MMDDTRPTPNVAPTQSTNVETRRVAWIGCGRCDNQWTGLHTCHCGACHETFTSISAFDRHRSGSHAAGTRHCLDPAARGLIPVRKKHWTGWGLPGTPPPRVP